MTPIMQVIEKSKKMDLKIINFVSNHMTNKVKTSHRNIYHLYISIYITYKLLTMKKTVYKWTKELGDITPKTYKHPISTRNTACSTSLFINEIQSKTSRQYLLTC